MSYYVKCKVDVLSYLFCICAGGRGMKIWLLFHSPKWHFKNRVYIIINELLFQKLYVSGDKWTQNVASVCLIAA